MLVGVLVGAALTVAFCNIPLGMLLAWGLAGGDGEPPNVLAPILGLGAFIAAGATAVATAGLLSPPARIAVLAVVTATVVVTVWWLSTYQEDAERRRLYAALLVVGVMVPITIGVAEVARTPSLATVATALAVPALALIGLPLAGSGLVGEGESWRSLLAPMGLLVTPPTLLGAAVVVA